MTTGPEGSGWIPRTLNECDVANVSEPGYKGTDDGSAGRMILHG